MATTANERARTARTDLQAWYLRGLLPKLVRAVQRGAVDAGAIEELDVEVRGLLDLSQAGEEAA